MPNELRNGALPQWDKIGFVPGARFIVKNIAPLIGTLTLLFHGKRVNKSGYEKRILIIFGGGIGDVVKRSIVCEYMRKYLSDYELYYLMPYSFEMPYAKEHIFFDYKKAKVNPGYYAALINQLRNIGFSKVIVVFPFWESFLSFLGGDIGSDVIFCHEEVAPNPFYDRVSRMNYFIRRSFIKGRMRFIHILSGWDREWKYERFPSDVAKHAEFISKVIAQMMDLKVDERGLLPLESPHTEICVDERIEASLLEKIKEDHGLKPFSYCVIGLGSSTVHRNWPVEKFIEVAKAIGNMGIKVVISEHVKDRDLAEKFMKGYPATVDLTGKTNLKQLFSLIKNSRILIANDTSFTHIGVALKVPSVCVIKNTGLGVDSLYGYRGISEWAFENSPEGETLSNVKVETVVGVCRNVLAESERNDWRERKFEFQYGSGF